MQRFTRQFAPDSLRAESQQRNGFGGKHWFPEERKSYLTRMGPRPACICRRISIRRFHRRTCFCCRGRRGNCSQCSAISSRPFCAGSRPNWRKSRCEIFALRTWVSRSLRRRLAASLPQSPELSLAIARVPVRLTCALSVAPKWSRRRRKLFAKNWATRSSPRAMRLWQKFFFPSDRETFKQLVAQRAFDLLRKQLTG